MVNKLYHFSCKKVPHIIVKISIRIVKYTVKVNNATLCRKFYYNTSKWQFVSFKILIFIIRNDNIM